jgi:hypothetical protein
MHIFEHGLRSSRLQTFRLTQQVKRYGITPTGTQRYRCYDCGRTFVITYSRKACNLSVQKQIVPMLLNGAGVRDTARALGIYRNTLSATIKSQQVLDIHPAYGHKSLTLILKVDESWSFVQAKKHPRWLWWVEEAVSGQVVAFVFGRRTHHTFRRLLSLLESAQIAVSK